LVVQREFAPESRLSVRASGEQADGQQHGREQRDFGRISADIRFHGRIPP
jgi:hypothetical protein